MISIIIPTIEQRQEHLERCLAAYERTTPMEYEFIVVRDEPTCGIAWNIGIAKSSGDLIHLTADDLEPHAGWLQAALGKIERGLIPAPRILKPDGSLESCGWDAKEHPEDETTPYSRIPIAPRSWFEAIGPMLETHYANDEYFSAKARLVGFDTVIARDYLFTHHRASQGRLDKRVTQDVATFTRVMKGGGLAAAKSEIREITVYKGRDGLFHWRGERGNPSKGFQTRQACKRDAHEKHPSAKIR